VAIQASIGHAVIHQKQLLLVPTITEQLNKIAVAEVTEDDDLGHELLRPPASTPARDTRLINSDCLV
jgi:hypothetical protein